MTSKVLYVLLDEMDLKNLEFIMLNQPWHTKTTLIKKLLWQEKESVEKEIESRR